MNIVTADSDEDRLLARDFLAQYIDDIAPDALPNLGDDDLYRPLVPWIRDDTGGVIAAALTCRNRYAARAAAILRRGDPMPPQAVKFLPVLDRLNRSGFDGDSRYLIPTSRLRSLGTA